MFRIYGSDLYASPVMASLVEDLDVFHSREAFMSPDYGQTEDDYDMDSLYNWSGEVGLILDSEGYTTLWDGACYGDGVY